MTRSNRTNPIARLAAASLAALAMVTAAPGQVLPSDIPDEIKGVKLIEHRGDTVPGDIELTDSKGRERTTGDYFDGERPVILIMAYYDCPLLCTLVLNRAQDALNGINWTLGEEYRVLTVSFDYDDTTEDAYSRQQEYLLGYKEVVPDEAWEFCTTDAENAKRLASAVGFHYKYLPEQDEYAHPSALIFLTPEGRINNYIENLIFPPRDVKLALVEASEGKQGSIFDRIQHFCFSYNREEGKYTVQAMNVMKLGGGITLAFVVGFIGIYTIISRRAREQRENDSNGHASAHAGVANT